jgi:hypothetical protein
VADDREPNPEWFRVCLETGVVGSREPPLVAAVGWRTDIGAVRSEQDVGDALRRVLEAVNDLHGFGLVTLAVLAHAVRIHHYPAHLERSAARDAFVAAAAEVIREWESPDLDQDQEP